MCCGKTLDDWENLIIPTGKFKPAINTSSGLTDFCWFGVRDEFSRKLNKLELQRTSTLLGGSSRLVSG